MGLLPIFHEFAAARGARVLVHPLLLLGVCPGVNPHSFRHAFAKLCLIDGGDLSLSDIMGHSAVKVTKDSYTVFVTDELKRKHDQYTPLSKLLRLAE